MAYRPAGTPEQLAARAAGRERRLGELHDVLTEQVAALRSGADWQRWLAVAARMPHYSFNNILLIAAQRPGATAVAGYGAWQALGRQVDRGERGIAILAPTMRRTRTPTDPADPAAADGPAPDPAPADPSQDPTGPAAADPGPARPGGFRAVRVFDVSQTSGTPLPEQPAPVLLTGQAPPGLWEALAAQVAARGFALRRGPCGNANGITHYGDRTVTVREDLPPAQAVKTLAHELAHVLLHDPTGLATLTATPADGGDTGTVPGVRAALTSLGQCRGRVEVEAESVAFLIAGHHGLNAGSYTFPYVAGWAEQVPGVTGEQVMRSSADRVLAAARVVLTAVEPIPGQAGMPAGRDARLEAAQDAAGLGAGLTAAAREQARQGEQSARTTPRPAAAARPEPPTTPASTPAAAVPGPGAARLLEVHRLAVDFYRRRLTGSHPDSTRARALLVARGVDPRATRQAGLGYAPAGWTALVGHLYGLAVTDEELLACGLASSSSRGTLVDRFRDRILFPVLDGQGRAVGLLGRAVDEAAVTRGHRPVPKYLNSPETTLYRKGEHLYGLTEARRAIEAGAVPVLVEGALDAITVTRAGTAERLGEPAFFGVAPSGTALTLEQVALLDAAVGGLADRGVIVAFDGDDAGCAAGVRAYHALRETSAWPHTMRLPAGSDPAQLWTEHGQPGLRAALLTAAGTPLADLVVDAAIERHAPRLQWVEGQVAAARDVAAVMMSMPPQHTARQAARLAARLPVDTAIVSRMLLDQIGGHAGPGTPPVPGLRPGFPEPFTHHAVRAPGSGAGRVQPRPARTDAGRQQPPDARTAPGLPGGA